MEKTGKVGITVIMPTYKQAQFISRAIRSLQSQHHTHWQLIIVNDGSPDNTREIIRPFETDQRIRYVENKSNEGLGYCLNLGIDSSDFDLIAYLPSDDIYFSDHLGTLCALLANNEKAILARSQRKIETNPARLNENPGEGQERPVQLVQVLHRKTADRWIERAELVTDDYRRLFFEKLEQRGEFINDQRVTCMWMEHPEQMSKIINERFDGGIYKYKSYYNVSGPLKFQSTYGNYISEADRYSYQKDPDKLPAVIKKGRQLKILLVGELAFNPDRMLAFEERGHRLYGLWIRNPSFINTVGPLPFGNIEDIPYENWIERVKEIKPDVIYALLNWKAVPLAHEVLTNKGSIPFVWHFKEDPFYCINLGTWKYLVDLFTRCDGRIFINQEVRLWFEQSLPEKNVPSFVLDGDLPKNYWFAGEQSTLLSDTDGEIHTVLAGRPIGFEIKDLKPIVEQRIHFHFYGEVIQSALRTYFEVVRSMARDYVHLHPNCDPANWVKEFSQYDAGWLHLFDSSNNGELRRANWNDLNYPARLSTFAAAGIPMILKDNSGQLVATETLVRKLGVGIPFKRYNQLTSILRDRKKMKELRENMWRQRSVFQFDTYVDELIGFFEMVILSAAR